MHAAARSFGTSAVTSLASTSPNQRTAAMKALLTIARIVLGALFTCGQAAIQVDDQIAVAAEIYTLQATSDHVCRKAPTSSSDQDSDVLEQKAEEGDVEALTAIVKPFLGQDAQRSVTPQALKWLTKAAEVGIADAQFQVGYALLFGNETQADDIAGVTWLKQAASHGQADAQSLLGFCYLWGKGVKKNHAVAVTFLETGVAANDAMAMHGLAICRENGWSVKKDQAEAFKLYRRAAREGLIVAQRDLARCYATGMGVESNAREAFVWMTQAAEAGDHESRFAVADFYARGFGVSRDPREACRRFRELAEDGYAEAQFRVAGFIYTGEGAAQDVTEACVWIGRAACQGHAEAQHALALMYHDGEGVPKNIELAYAWASIAAAQGVRDAAKLRDGLEPRMTRQQVATAQRMALAFEPKAEEPDSTSDVELTSSGRNRYVTGSGFFVTNDGYFVTNHHVIVDAQRITVKTAAGALPAKVVRVDSVNDIAVLKVSGSFAALPVRGSGSLRLADRVATVGFPNPDIQGVAPKYSSGEVAALTGLGDDPRYIQISVPIQGGNSGGPLVDARGFVVGVVAAGLNKEWTAKETGDVPENVNYAVKGSLLVNLLESLGDATPFIAMASTGPVKSASDVARATEEASGMVIVQKE